MSIYENHLFDKELPIIFHLDNVYCISNYHENIELLYCIAGTCKVVINSKTFEMKKGSIIAINSGNIHYTMPNEENVLYYCLIISSHFLKRYGINVEEVHFVENVTDIQGIHFFEKICQEYEKKEPFYKTMIVGEILTYLSHLCRNHTAEKNNVKDDIMVKSGMDYIRQHFKEDISVDDVAEYAGFSRFYFSRQFKAATGNTITDYIQFIRCQNAYELLQDGNITISEAAMESGFTDSSYFTKIFKKWIGKLPSEITIAQKRKNNKELPNTVR